MRFFNFDGLAIKFITEEANKIAEQARLNAGWSTRIPDAIFVGAAEIVGEGRYSIDIIVDVTPDVDWRNPNPRTAPEAAAFEYGSGLHGEDGETYPIAPKFAPVLAFDWPGHDPDFPPGRKFIGVSEKTGKFMFNFVDHPGVAANPFLQPAVEKNRRAIRNRLAKLFKRGIMDSIKVGFRDVSQE